MLKRKKCERRVPTLLSPQPGAAGGKPGMGGEEGGGGSAGGVGGVAGGVIGGGGGMLRGPQSAQSVPRGQFTSWSGPLLQTVPGPPSSHRPSYASEHELEHTIGGLGVGGQLFGASLDRPTRLRLRWRWGVAASSGA